MNPLQIADRSIGPESPVYIIAEMSANHGHDLDHALRLVAAAKDAGADAIKLQTYTPDTMTIDCEKPCFQIGKGTVWEGKNLYQLYQEAYTPWDWHPRLMQEAANLGLHCFSSPFDQSAVDFLESLNTPAYKIASFELIDIPLLKAVAATGKPVIASTGMASLAEIEEAVLTLRENGCKELALLKCVSSYPAFPEDMNLITIAHLTQTFDCVSGLSDHSLEPAVPVTAVALGARIIEKHLTLSRDVGGPDSSFSMEPHEFAEMVRAVRTTEASMGRINYKITEKEEASRVFRRSLFVVHDIAPGEFFTEQNVRCIRPGDGLHPRYYTTVLGQCSAMTIPCGTPLSWKHLAAPSQG